MKLITRISFLISLFAAHVSFASGVELCGYLKFQPIPSSLNSNLTNNGISLTVYAPSGHSTQLNVEQEDEHLKGLLIAIASKGKNFTCLTGDFKATAIFVVESIGTSI